MNIKLASRNFSIPNRLHQDIIKRMEKIIRVIPWKDSDYPLLDIIVRKKRKKSLDHIEKRLISEYEINPPAGGHKSVDNPVYYDGTIKLIMPKRPLIVSLLGKTPEEAFVLGFDHLEREIGRYKGTHLKSHSEYFDHDTIRRD